MVQDVIKGPVVATIKDLGVDEVMKALKGEIEKKHQELGKLPDDSKASGGTTIVSYLWFGREIEEGNLGIRVELAQNPDKVVIMASQDTIKYFGLNDITNNLGYTKK